MKKVLVYDFPTRLFHWVFSGLFVAAFSIAKIADSESSLYPIHMLLGLTLTFVVILRVFWGFLGSKHAQFRDWVFNPKEVFEYFMGIIQGAKNKWVGHNPASSWSALLMMILALGSGVTGYLMASGRAKENLEDIHELCGNSFAVVALVHILGVIVHSFRHREMLGLTMIHGRKKVTPSEAGIQKSYGFVGIVFLILVVAFLLNLIRNYNEQRGTLNLFGLNLVLAEDKMGEEP